MRRNLDMFRQVHRVNQKDGCQDHAVKGGSTNFPLPFSAAKLDEYTTYITNAFARISHLVVGYPRR